MEGLIPPDLLKLYFASAIDIRRSAKFPWRRLYEGYRLDGEVVDEFVGGVANTVNHVVDGSDSGSFSGRRDRSSLAILTAWNPRGVKVSGLENDLANRRLFDDLLKLGFSYGESLFDSLGLDTTPGSAYHEVGYAIVEDDGSASVEVTRRYGQLAVYKISDGCLSVVDCQGGLIHYC